MPSVVLIYFEMKLLIFSFVLKEIKIKPYIETLMYPSCNSMKLSKNVISGAMVTILLN